jgi:four helix bundle protein
VVKSHEDLEVWQVAVALAKQLYELTAASPREERFGLTAQLRKSAVSIPSNIAEGAARQGTKESVQFLYISAGSAS